VIRGVAMTRQSPAPNLVNSTFGKSAVVLDYALGYATIPAGAYFGTEFSVSCWVKMTEPSAPRLFDFRDYNNNRILLSVSGHAGFYFYFLVNGAPHYTPITPLSLNKWTFVVVTYKDRVLKYYFNETYVGGTSYTTVAWTGATTTLNCFGKDTYGSANWGQLGLIPESDRSNTQIFDFKIYDRVISEEARLFDLYNGTFTVQELYKN